MIPVKEMALGEMPNIHVNSGANKIAKNRVHTFLSTFKYKDREWNESGNTFDIDLHSSDMENPKADNKITIVCNGKNIKIVSYSGNSARMEITDDVDDDVQEIAETIRKVTI